MPMSEATKANSATTSRLDVASIEFSAGPDRPSLLATRAGVETERAAGERSRPVRRHRCPRPPVAEALEISDEWPRVGEQVVREQNRLGMLQMGAARHRVAEVGVRLRGDRVDERHQLVRDGRGMVEQVQPDQGGDLVVAAASGAELAAELRPGDPDQLALQGAVHVFIGVGRDDAAVEDGGFEPVEGGRHPTRFVVGEVSGCREGRRVRPGTGDVVPRELPVELGRSAQGGQFRRRARGESRAPERAGIGGAVGHDPARSSSHTSRAFCAWRRFSASSHTTLCGPSITSAVTSYPRSAGRQCMKSASGLASDIISASTR